MTASDEQNCWTVRVSVGVSDGSSNHNCEEEILDTSREKATSDMGFCLYEALKSAFEADENGEYGDALETLAKAITCLVKHKDQLDEYGRLCVAASAYLNSREIDHFVG